MGKFITGFITGILVIALVLGLGGYFLLTGVNVATLEEWFHVDLTPGENNTNGDKSILDMSKMIIATAQNLPNTSLDDLKKEYGIDFMQLLKNKFGDKDYSFLNGVMSCGLGSIPEELKKIEMGNFMTLAGVNFSDAVNDILSPLLTSTLNDLTVEGGAGKVMQNVINGITISSLKSLDPNLLPADIPLFNDPMHQQDKLVDIFAEISKTDGNIKLKDFLNITESSPFILKSLGDTSIGGLENKIKTLKVGDVFDATDPGTSPILVDLANENLLSLASTFDTKIRDVKISALIGDIAPQGSLLYELHDSTLNTINTDIVQKVNTATLNTLKQWGVLPQELDTTKTFGGVALGEMTLVQLIEAINQLPST